MIVAFRADASVDIGTGHCMRCLNLATALKEKGAQCIFLSQGGPGNINNLIRQLGFELKELDSQIGQFDVTTDVENTKLLIEGLKLDWLVIDHYKIGAEWQLCMRENCRKILVIEDLANRRHDCDLLLDGNVGRQANDYVSYVPDNCEMLIGPEFLLIDPLCHNLESSLRSGTMIFLGGGDNQDDLETLIPVVGKMALPMPISIILGQSQPNKDKLREACNGHGIDCYLHPRDFKQRCNQATLALVRCGLISYELAILKTPSICFWREGIHRIVATWLDKNEYCVASTVETFITTEFNSSIIAKALDYQPKQPLQTKPGQQAVIQYMKKVLSP